MFLTYKYRLLPNKKQHQELKAILDEQRFLYNAALQERIECYKKTKKTITLFDQMKSLTEWRKETVGKSNPANLQRWTLRRLDDAYKAFFARLKLGGKAGFPRFRSKYRWNSFGFNEFSGITIKGSTLKFKGITGKLKVHMHRELLGNVKSCVMSKDIKGWSVSFQVEIPAVEKREGDRLVGIDLGLNVFAYLSDGTQIPNPRVAKNAEKQVRVRQRALSRCKKGSKRREKVKVELARVHDKIKNTRSTFLHQSTAMLIREYDIIGVEDLNIKGMSRGFLSKSIHDVSWAKFLGMLTYKAEGAGVYVSKVDPRNTSKKCSGCGTLVPKTLAMRTHTCPSCELVIDRDWNASINIARAVMCPENVNVVC